MKQAFLSLHTTHRGYCRYGLLLICLLTLPHIVAPLHAQTVPTTPQLPLLLSAELHNSSTGSAEYMRPIWRRMREQGVATVLAVVSWEMIEPEPGRYDFAQLDSIIAGARCEGLKVGVLWFGSWKNGVSTYVPSWVKLDQRRFPLARFADGSAINALSTLGAESVAADAKAFAAMMRRIAETDTEHTVVLVQVENEVGVLDAASTFAGTPNRGMRDYSPLSNRAFAGQVPQQLTAYLASHRRELHPAIRAAWEKAGSKSRGSWEEVFGKGRPSSGTDNWADEYPYLTEEIFQAWHYAAYIETVAAAGKRELRLPMYVNAWLKQSGGREPGRYPSGGPLPHVFDIWRAAAPSIDFFAPDIYAVDRFDETCAEFSRGGNPLFIPETPADAGGAARAFYAIGKYRAIGYSPFGFDGGGIMLDASTEDHSYAKAYRVLRALAPQFAVHPTHGLMTNAERREDSTVIGSYRISMASFSAERAFAVAGVRADDNPNRNPNEVAALMIIELSKDEFIIAGFGDTMVGITLAETAKDGRQAGLLEVDELSFTDDGRTISRRLNGDETALGGVVIPTGEARAYRVKMYTY